MSGSPGEGYETQPFAAARAIGARWRLWPQLDVRGWQNATLLSLLLALEFAALMITPMAVDTDSFWGMAQTAAVGSTLAPPTLLALWAVFGPGALSIRLPLTIWLATASYVTILFAATRESGAAAGESFIYIGSWLLAFACLQPPLWLLRAVRRWRLVQTAPGGPLIDSKEKRGNQLTLRALLGWTFAAAVLLAATRALMPEQVIGAEVALEAAQFVGLGGLLIAAAGLPVVALAWIFLATGRRPILRLILSLLLIAGLTGGVWIVVYVEDFLEINETICILVGAIANGLITLSVIAACGYRLICEPRSSTPEPAGDAVFVARRPLSGYRFALAMVPLGSVAVALVCELPFQLRQ